jgi:hypothetical protein
MMTLVYGGAQRERSSTRRTHQESDESTSIPHRLTPSSFTNTQQPTGSTMDDDDEYLDSLRRGRLESLRGNLPGDNNQNLSYRQVEGGMAFAAVPPDFNNRMRTRSSSNRDDTKGSRFQNKGDESPRDRYWKNNHPVSETVTWGTIQGNFPIIPPITEIVAIKNAVYNSFVSKVEETGTKWKDRSEFFISKFEDIVPTASLTPDMAIRELQNIDAEVFAFSDVEILDANLAPIAGGAGIDFPALARARTRYLRFTITVHPRNINTGAIDIDQHFFPLPQATVVYVRALLVNGALAPIITKAVLETNPKFLVFLYAQAHTEFDICIKDRYDAAPDPEKYQSWLREVTAKTKFMACKEYIWSLYVGRLEGTETLAQ